MMHILFGRVGLYSTNISRNSVKYVSCFSISSVNDLCTVNYSTFASNTASLSCMEHGVTKYSFYDFHCNIINNSQTGYQSGCVVAYAKVIVKNCNVIGQYGNGKPFATDSAIGVINPVGNLLIINCIVENFDIYQTRSGKYSTSGNIEEAKLSFLSFENHYCKAVVFLTLKLKNVETLIIENYYYLIYILPLNLFFPC